MRGPDSSPPRTCTVAKGDNDDCKQSHSTQLWAEGRRSGSGGGDGASRTVRAGRWGAISGRRLRVGPVVGWCLGKHLKEVRELLPVVLGRKGIPSRETCVCLAGEDACRLE